MDKELYLIKEVAECVDEPLSTLRYWEKEFQYIINPRRNEGGRRLYSEKDIEDVRLIKYLVRDCKLTYDGVHKRLKDNRESSVRQARAVNKLRAIRAELKILADTLELAASPNPEF